MRAKGLSKVLATAAILLLLAWFVDLNEALLLLKQTDWHWLIPVVLVIQFQVVLSAIRWKITAGRLGQSLTLRRAISEYYLATVANMSLPGGITGDAARIYRNRESGSLGVSVHGVVLERVAGQFALLLIVIVGWLCWPLLMSGSVPAFGVQVLGTTALLIMLIGAGCYLLVKFAPDRITRAVLDFGPALYVAWWSDRQWIVQGVLSIAIVSSYLLVFLLCSYAVQAPLPFFALVTIVPLVLLSMLIPLSIGGWGIREAAAAVLWPVAGLSAEAGIATSIAYALLSLVGSLPGLVLWLATSRD